MTLLPLIVISSSASMFPALNNSGRFPRFMLSSLPTLMLPKFLVGHPNLREVHSRLPPLCRVRVLLLPTVRALAMILPPFITYISRFE